MSGDENLNPELARIIAELRHRVGQLESKVAPVGAQSLNDLDDVYINVVVRADADVLTWVEANQDWEALAGGGASGFPITYDDGSFTYTIKILSGNIINQVTDNGAGDALLSQTFLGADGLIELDDYTGGGIFLRCTDGGGGIHLVDTSDGGIFLQADNAGGVVVNSNDGGFIGLNAEGGIFLSDSSGVVFINGLPTSDPVDTGRLWNDSGTLKISL